MRQNRGKGSASVLQHRATCGVAVKGVEPFSARGFDIALSMMMQVMCSGKIPDVKITFNRQACC